MTTGFRSMPVLACKDVDRSIVFYQTVVGMELINVYKEGDDPAEFAIMQFGQITLALQRVADWTAHGGWSAYFYVSDARKLATEIEARGGTLARQPEETFYGILEFDLPDPEGHVIAFGQDLAPGPAGPGL